MGEEEALHKECQPFNVTIYKIKFLEIIHHSNIAIFAPKKKIQTELVS